MYIVRDHIYTCTYIVYTFLNVYVMDSLCRDGGCGSEPVEDGGILASGTAAVKGGRWRERGNEREKGGLLCVVRDHIYT